MLLRRVLKMARTLGAFTEGQAAYYLGMSPREAQEKLDKFVANGLLKAVDIAGTRFYYRDPVEAAEVILNSLDVFALPPEERKKLLNL